MRAIKVERAISDYFHDNNVEDISLADLWTAHKATIRAKLIQLSSQINRARRADIERLEKDFLSLSKQQKCDPKSIPMAKTGCS